MSEENFLAPNAVKKDIRREKVRSLAKEVEYAREGFEQATVALENAKRSYVLAREKFDERLKRLADYAAADDDRVPAASSAT